MDATCGTANKFIDDLATELQNVLPSEDEQKVFIENFVAAFATKPSQKYNDDFYFDIVKPTISTLIRLKEDSAKIIGWQCFA